MVRLGPWWSARPSCRPHGVAAVLSLRIAERRESGRDHSLIRRWQPCWRGPAALPSGKFAANAAWLLAATLQFGNFNDAGSDETADCWDAIGRWPGGPLVRMVDSVEIDRPASLVWAYVADYGNDTSWRAAVTQMRPSVPGPAQVGVTTHELLRLVGMIFRTDTTIELGGGRTLAPVASPQPAEAAARHSPGGADRPARPFTEVVEGRLLGLSRPLEPSVAWRLSGRPCRPAAAETAPGGAGPQRVRTGAAGDLRRVGPWSLITAAPSRSRSPPPARCPGPGRTRPWSGRRRG